ncbi:protein-export chaperone SecB [Clostridium estertheticum]|uniref:protein-export chaperone SecB n=1 Tax=Clostridium estertheticum TaxID=238834 RepID=UPI001CF4A458|nr:protein-export chaperone SecB [Clostridium estertheticum]MCB2360296.1 protein-export chaperone SecB [Clostridium estertheticum]
MKGQVVKSSLKLNEIFVEKVEFKRSENFNKSANNELKFKFESSINEKDTNNYKVSIKVNISSGAAEELVINVIMCALFGFVFNEKLSNDIIKSMLEKNTLAIMYPYVRSYITNLSAQSGINPIILPTINISAMIDSQENSYNSIEK